MNGDSITVVARPRSISDDRLLAAAMAVVERGGPGFTLAQVAAEAGVAVGTVAQRFGSKSGLLQAMSRAGTRWTVDAMRSAAAGADTWWDGLRAAAIASHADLDDERNGDARGAVNHLAQLGVDLGDPDLRALLGAHFAAVEAELRRFVRRAVDDRWCGPAPTRAARALLSVVTGSALDWSIRPKGRLADRLGADLDSVLARWRIDDAE